MARSMYQTGGGTVERIAKDGTRSTVLEGISSPAGIAIDTTGAVLVSSYSGDYIVRIARTERRRTLLRIWRYQPGLLFLLMDALCEPRCRRNPLNQPVE